MAANPAFDMSYEDRSFREHAPVYLISQDQRRTMRLMDNFSDRSSDTSSKGRRRRRKVSTGSQSSKNSSKKDAAQSKHRPERKSESGLLPKQRTERKSDQLIGSGILLKEKLSLAEPEGIMEENNNLNNNKMKERKEESHNKDVKNEDDDDEGSGEDKKKVGSESIIDTLMNELTSGENLGGKKV